MGEGLGRASWGRQCKDSRQEGQAQRTGAEGQASFKKCDSEETFSLVQERTMRLLNGGGNLWAALTSGCGGGVYPWLLSRFCPVPVQELRAPELWASHTST